MDKGFAQSDQAGHDHWINIRRYVKRIAHDDTTAFFFRR